MHTSTAETTTATTIGVRVGGSGEELFFPASGTLKLENSLDCLLVSWRSISGSKSWPWPWPWPRIVVSVFVNVCGGQLPAYLSYPVFYSRFQKQNERSVGGVVIQRRKKKLEKTLSHKWRYGRGMCVSRIMISLHKRCGLNTHAKKGA